MALYCGIGSDKILRMTLHLPYSGVWWAECEFENEAASAAPGSAVTISFDDLSLEGTADPAGSGVFGVARSARIIGGGAGWATSLPAKGYANDARIKAYDVAYDAAQEAGETLGDVDPESERLATHYSRRAAPASTTLADVIGGSRIWWVGLDGNTNVAAARPARPAPSPNDYQILEYNAREMLATLSVDSPGVVLPGDVLTIPADLSGGTATTLNVRDVEIELSSDSLRVRAWCGSPPVLGAGLGRLAGTLRAMIEHTLGGSLFGAYRYRVVSMHVDGRVNLQAVSSADGLPDALRVPQWSGCAGAHAELALGSEVLVQFIGGRREEPIVSGYAGREGPSHVPDQLVLASEDNSAPYAARQGDTVRVLLPPAVFTGVIGGAPASGVITFPAGYTLGTVETASGKVKIG